MLSIPQNLKLARGHYLAALEAACMFETTEAEWDHLMALPDVYHGDWQIVVAWGVWRLWDEERWIPLLALGSAVVMTGSFILSFVR